MEALETTVASLGKAVEQSMLMQSEILNLLLARKPGRDDDDDDDHHHHHDHHATTFRDSTTPRRD